MINLVRKLQRLNTIRRPLLYQLLLITLLIVFDIIRANPFLPAAVALKTVEPEAPSASRPLSGRPVLTAHRGASARAPENTMAAFRLAERLGVDYIELDVQRSKDGRLVVIHDASVDRTTDGTGNVDSYTYEELRRFDAGRWFGAAYAGERIPSLDEVLDAFFGRTGLLIELKNPGRYPGIAGQLAEQLAERLRREPFGASRLIVQSFDHTAVRHFHDRLPSVPVAVLTSGRRMLRSSALRGYAGYAAYVNVEQGAASRRSLARIHRHRLRAMVWTVHAPGKAVSLLRAGADGIITDDPALVRRNAKQPNDVLPERRSGGIIRLLHKLGQP